MDENLPRVFSEKERALIITPAGCGKTEIIAKAVSFSDSTKGKQLILTHTHAGVKSIHDRLRKLEVSRRLYHIDTIAGFALQYAISFPLSSGLGSNFDPTTHEWDVVYSSAQNVVSSPFGKKIIDATFCGMYVDEYQDCTLQQHNLILKLAEILPCRIVGDPLQGIFGFKNNPIVNWYKDVFPNFADRNTKTEWVPWRWKNKNEDLGKWLMEQRENLLRGKPLEIQKPPAGVEMCPLNLKNQIGICMNKANKKGESIIAIQKWASEAHSMAMKLNGAYSSMEEVESKSLLEWAEKLERFTGRERAIAAIDFAETCMTAKSLSLSTVREKIEAGESPKRAINHQEVYDELMNTSKNDDLSAVLGVLDKVENIDGRILYRPELWHDMKRAIKEKVTSTNNVSLQKTAWNIRYRERVWGRRVDRHTISRTLLIKGLEFDHAIVLNADELDAKELYVAITRGSKSLTIFASNPVLQKAPPADLRPPPKAET